MKQFRASTILSKLAQVGIQAQSDVAFARGLKLEPGQISWLEDGEKVDQSKVEKVLRMVLADHEDINQLLQAICESPKILFDNGQLKQNKTAEKIARLEELVKINEAKLELVLTTLDQLQAEIKQLKEVMM